MADSRSIQNSGATGVAPSSYSELQLREGWGTQGASDRPDRLTMHTSREEADVGALGAALGGVALVLIATLVLVVLFAF